MTTLSASQARAKLDRLVDHAQSSQEPVLIAGKRNKAVLLAEEDWRAIQETLYLLSIPGMRESIRNGLKTPLKKCWSGGTGRRTGLKILPRPSK